EGAAKRAAVAGPAADERPTPPLTRTDSRRRMAWLIVLSLLAHVGFFALSWNEVEPLESVSIEAISVEIVLGGETVAGIAEKPQEIEAEPAAAVEQVEPDVAAEQQEPATQ